MGKYRSMLARNAEQAAIERHVNQEKQDLFIQGAEWAIQTLWKCVETSHYDSMVGKTTEKYLEGLRADDFRQFILDFEAALPKLPDLDGTPPTITTTPFKLGDFIRTLKSPTPSCAIKKPVDETDDSGQGGEG